MFSLKTRGIISIIGSCCLNLTVGSTYILGNINIYLSSYFPNVTSDQTNIVFPFTTLFGNIVIILSIPLCIRFGLKKVLFFSSICIYSFILASSFCTNFWLFFICFGLGYGGTIGFVYLNIILNAYKYFPTRRGLIGGVLMGVYGMASLISNYIMLYIMNPDNKKALKDENGEYYFEKDIADRLPNALRVLSFYLLGTMIIGNIMIFQYKEEPVKQAKQEIYIGDGVGDNKLNIEEIEEIMKKRREISENFNKTSLLNDIEKKREISENFNKTSVFNERNSEKTEPLLRKSKDNNDNSYISAVTMDKSNTELEPAPIKKDTKPIEQQEDIGDETRCTSLYQAFHSKALYLMIIMTYFSIQNGYFIASNFKNYGIGKISDDNFLTLIGSLSCVCNGGGRFIWGYIYDKFSFKSLYITMLFVQMLDIVTMRYIAEYKGLYLLWVCIALLCEGGHFVLIPAYCLKIFGPEVGGKAYSVILMGIAFANLTQFGLNLGLREYIGFENEFYIYLGFSAISMAVCLTNKIRF